MKFDISNLDECLQQAVMQVNSELNLSLSSFGVKIYAEKIQKGYEVSLENNILKIGYDSIPAFLRALLKFSSNGGNLKGACVFNELGVMLDMSRNAVATVGTVKKFARILALLGYNYLNLYTEDTFEIPENEYFGYMRGRYTESEIKEIDAFCREIGIELIPCIQTLAHINQITRYHSYGDIIDIYDILLCGEQKTYELIENMFKSLRSSFTSRKVNIGMDEAHMLGLGKYLDKHGYTKRYDIMLEHLNKVLEIADRYGFECRMWSDMFFRLAFSGDYDGDMSKIPAEVIDNLPKNVKLIYWDYYSVDYNKYDRSIKNHRCLTDNIGFAGGAWKWTGFTSDNDYSIKTMNAALSACRDNGIDDCLITCWGDNGAEASMMSVLPAIYYAAEMAYSAEIEYAAFEKLTGITFENFMLVDSPNKIKPEADIQRNNSSKFFLYDDMLYGTFDSLIEDSFFKIYAKNIKAMEKVISRAGKYAYIFKYMKSLTEVLEIKTALSLEIKKVYKDGDRAKMMEIAKVKMPKLIAKVKAFYTAFKNAWHMENKPFGFEVQDHRLGGLIQRLKTINEKLLSFVSGKADKISELEEGHLPYNYNGKLPIELMYFNEWRFNISPSVV